MHFPLLRLLAVACVGAALAAPAPEIAMTGLSVPVFNAAGELTHRIVAREGVKSGPVQKLRTVEVLFFAPGDPTKVTQKIETDEAEWNDRKKILTGERRVQVTTLESTLSGEKFDFALATSLLHIHRDFSLRNAELQLNSDRATIELVVEHAGETVKFRDVKRWEASGHLVITVAPAAVAHYRFEKAYSERAIYDGEARTIVLPEPTRTISKDLTSTVQTMRLNLGPRESPP